MNVELTQADLSETLDTSNLNETETRTYVLQSAIRAGLISRPLTDAQFKKFYALTKGDKSKIDSELDAFIANCSEETIALKAPKIKRRFVGTSAVLILVLSILAVLVLSNKSVLLKNMHGYWHKVVPTVKTAAGPEPLMSFVASWRDFSTSQPVYFATPKRMVLQGDDENELMEHTVAVIDKVLIIPEIKVDNATVALDKPKLTTKISGNGQTKREDMPHQKGIVNPYTIQLLATRKPQQLQNFRKKNNLVRNTQIRHLKDPKGSWYVLTYGAYNTKASAQLSAKKLPLNLSKLNPWVRHISVKDIG